MRIPERLPSIFETSKVELQNGSSTAPGLFFTSDPDLGLYRVSANKLGIAASSGVQSNGVLNGPNGLVSAPTYSFTSDTDTGFFWSSSGYILCSTNGTGVVGFRTTGLLLNDIGALNTGTTRMRGAATDGATAIGLKMGNENSLVTAGAKIMAWYSDNVTTERAYLSAAGIFGTGTLIANAAGTVAILNDSADVSENNAGWLEIQALNGTRYRMPVWAI